MEPTSPSQTEISSEVSMTIGDTIEEFQDTVEEILAELKKDEPFSEISADSYERKKCYLRNQLDDLCHFHSVLADKHLQLIDEVSKNCPSLLHPSDSAVKDDALKVKDISESDLKIKKMEGELDRYKKRISIAEDLIKNLKGEKSSKLFQENQKLKHELDLKQNQVNMAAEYVTSKDREVHELEEQMDACVVAIRERDTINRKLKSKNDGYQSEIKRLEEILKSKEEILKDAAKLKGQLKNQTKSNDELKKQLVNSRSERSKVDIKMKILKEEKRSQEKVIKELNTSLNALQVQYEGVVSSFEEERCSKDDFIQELETRHERVVSSFEEVKCFKDKSIRELEIRLKVLQLEYERVVLSFEEERCSKEKSIQELETSLKTLQDEHVRVVLSFEDAEKIQTELIGQIVDLNLEVEIQKEVISDAAKEKIEAIRQLSVSLDHYMTEYNQLKKAYDAKKTGCFEFLTVLNR